MHIRRGARIVTFDTTGLAHRILRYQDANISVKNDYFAGMGKENTNFLPCLQCGVFLRELRFRDERSIFP